MNYFLAKTEKHEYGIDDLEKDGKIPWTGVNNPQAKNFLKSMKKGDIVYIYHTGDIKAIVGIATVLTEGEIPVFGFKKKFPVPLATLSEIKSIKEFSDLKLVRQSRLSVMDVPDKLLKYLQEKSLKQS